MAKPTPSQGSERTRILGLLERMVVAIREGDETAVEDGLVLLSQRHPLLAPLALAVGALVMLFHGVRLLVINWRLTLVQVVPAILIWLAMFDLRLHVVQGKELDRVFGPIGVPFVAAIAALTAAAYFLNAVFAFAIAEPGTPEIRPAVVQARRHLVPVLSWGLPIGCALGFAVVMVPRWGKGWFALSLGIMVAVLMVTYVAVPSRLIGITPERSRKDQVTASVVVGVLGAVVCSPPYLLGRLGIVLLGTRSLFAVGIVMLAFAVPLQTGAVTATQAVKFSTKLLRHRVYEGPAPAQWPKTPMSQE